MSTRSARKSDERKFRDQQQTALTAKAEAARRERLEHARTVGIRLISHADELSESAVAIQDEMAKLYAGLLDQTMNDEKFKPVQTKVGAAADARDAARKTLRTLRAELEIVAPRYLIDAANDLIAGIDALYDSSDDEPEGDEERATCLEIGWINGPIKAYAAQRVSMIEALKRFGKRRAGREPMNPGHKEAQARRQPRRQGGAPQCANSAATNPPPRGRVNGRIPSGVS